MTTNSVKIVLENSNFSHLVSTSDLLIAKPTDKVNEYELIAFSIFGLKSELNRVIKKRGGLKITFVNSKSQRITLIAKSMENFDMENVDGKSLVRRVFVKKKSIVIDPDEVSSSLVFVPKSKEAILPRYVFETVRNNITAPLFPNYSEASIIAKELLITKEEAAESLERIQKGRPITEIDFIVSDGFKRYINWCDHLFNEFNANGHIKPLINFCWSGEETITSELLFTEQEVRDCISNGLRDGIISISNKNVHNVHYDSFDSYMKNYTSIFKDVIEHQVNPLHRNGDISEAIERRFDELPHQPISMQKDTIVAMLKSLDHQNRVNLVGEPGVGKTFMMSTVGYFDALSTGKFLKGLILSPDHLVEAAWEKDIKNFLPEVKVHHIKSISDLMLFEKNGLLDDEVHRYFVLGQTISKNGYSLEPKAIYNSRRSHFCCPNCNGVITKLVKNEPYKIKLGEPAHIKKPAPGNFFTSKTNTNSDCPECSSPLWGPMNRKATSFQEFTSVKKKKKTKKKTTGFVYTENGYYPRDIDFALKYLSSCREAVKHKNNRTTKSALENAKLLLATLRGKEKEKNPVSSHKVPVSTFIFKKMNKRFSHLIIDEFHEYQTSTSSRTGSAGALISSVRKVITGTGTMMNGYARSIFFNLFMLFPQKMMKAGFNVDDGEKFQVAFGVSEKIYRFKEGAKRLHTTKMKPGISPVIFHKFLQDSTVFISMKDLKTAMPELVPSPVPVPLSPALDKGRKEFEAAVKKHTYGNLVQFKSMIPALYSYLDSPTVPKEVKDEFGTVVYTTPPVDDSENLKLEKLKSILTSEAAQGKRTIVYTYYTSDGINDYLHKELSKEGFKVTVLNKNSDFSLSCDGSTEKVGKISREAFINKEVKKGTEVLIVNPTLVQTGLNLIEFSSIVYYQMSYQVYTVRQADRRTWRIGQTNQVNIYYLYYADSFQAEIASLMATKVIASQAIEGEMDSKGLDAISSTRTPEEELAKKFFEHMNLT